MVVLRGKRTAENTGTDNEDRRGSVIGWAINGGHHRVQMMRGISEVEDAMQDGPSKMIY